MDHSKLLCETCIMDPANRSLSLLPLPRLANDLFANFRQAFSDFSAQVSSLQKMNTQSWKTDLRLSILGLFDSLQDRLRSCRESQLRAVTKMIADVDVSKENKMHNSLIRSQGQSTKVDAVLNEMMERNQYATLSGM
jgi:hypothetical protein